MVLVLPSVDADLEDGMRLLQRVTVAKYDVEDSNKHLAERFVSVCPAYIFQHIFHALLSFCCSFEPGFSFLADCGRKLDWKWKQSSAPGWSSTRLTTRR